MRNAVVLLALAAALGCDGPHVGADSGTPEDAAQGPSCSDGVRNQDESDVDCGGACGATCAPGARCGAGGDCASGRCEGGVCLAAPSCSDGARGGSETDVDCGGAECPPCEDGRACAADRDCVSDSCGDDGTCAAAICGDGIANGAEECDVGAGGVPGESATCDADCTAASCGDGTTNGAAGEECDEGGAQTASCEIDCVLARCGDGVVNTLAGEECDGDGAGAGGETETCDADCTAQSCGDGVTNEIAGEECDDGNTVDDDACSNACELRVGGLVIASDATIDTDLGELDGAPLAGWDGAVLTVDDLVVPAGVRVLVRGSQPLSVVAFGDVTIAGVLDLSGQDGGDAPGCAMPGAAGGAGGPGGGAGGQGGGFGGAGVDGSPGQGSGAGGGGPSNVAADLELAGGGGGGHRAAGAHGHFYPPTAGGAAGAAYAALASLEGGSGGGGGSVDDYDPQGYDAGDAGGAGGGGGGGAARIEAHGTLVVSGTIDASGGAGGDGDACDAGGGGGGSGGTIVLVSHTAAPTTTGATLDVRGGAGGPAFYAPGGAGAEGEVYVGLPPTCADGATNQDESDTDCGGAVCGACADALACRADSDCASATCRGGACRPASCADGARSGAETDVDCGGAECAPCAGGGLCVSGTDCVTGACSAVGECGATSFADDFEGGPPLGPGWSTSGAAGWLVSGATPLSGTYSARSGAIGDGETSGLALTVTCWSPGSITFTFRTDTELGFDRLVFAIDGTERLGWSGIESALTVRYPLGAGTRALSWAYEKDTFGSEGADAVFLDDVVVAGCAP